MRILALAAGMVMVAVLAAWVAFTFLTRGGEVTVPALEGVELRAALELASRDQLGLRVRGTGYDLGTPPGYVISQDPLPGVRIKANRIIYVVVSQGTPSVFIPNLSSLTLRRAELQLAQAGLTLGKIGHTHMDETTAGSVIAQSPPPGRFVPRSSSIDLLLSDGSRPLIYLLPDMTGFPMETVLSRIRDWNMRSGRIMEVVDEHVPQGTVVALTPPPGSAVIEGQSIHLTVTRMAEPAPDSQIVLYQHTEPYGLLDRTISLVLVTKEEEKTVWEGPVAPGSSVSIPVVVSSPGVLKVYADNEFLEEMKVP
jgi:serine/threonine-protein kinase